MNALPPVPMEPAGSGYTQSLLTEERIDFVEYWRSILKRKWQIVGLAIGVALIAAMVVYSMRPVYRSTATVLIEFGKSRVVSIEEVYSGASANREFLQTQVEILKSRELAKKVVMKLALNKSRLRINSSQDLRFNRSAIPNWSRSALNPMTRIWPPRYRIRWLIFTSRAISKQKFK